MAMRDPNPLVAGQGAARLRAAGIAVDVGAGGDEARELNIGFVSRMERGRPWLRLKAAVSLDGRTRARQRRQPMDHRRGGARRRPRLAQARRRRAHRRRHGARRRSAARRAPRAPPPRQPLRVIVDSRLQTPPTARILAAPGSVLSTLRDRRRRRSGASCEARGVEVALLPGPSGKVDLRGDARRPRPARHQRAARRSRREAQRLAAARRRWSTSCCVYVAPRLLGSGRGLAALGAVRDARRRASTFASSTSTRVGDDLRLRLRPASLTAFRVTPRDAPRRGDNRRMFTGIVSGVGRIVERAARSAAGASFGKRADDRGAAGLSRRRRDSATASPSPAPA